METSRSPWKVLREAHALAQRVWPVLFSSPFSRHDFTRPQLFACLVLREQLKLSYRKTEALLGDSPHWLAAIGMCRAPDHNTLWRAFGLLMETRRVSRMMDLLATLSLDARMLGTLSSGKPLTIDSTCYERRYRSRHYERVCRKMKLSDGAKYAEKTGMNVTPEEVNRSRSAAASPNRHHPRLCRKLQSVNAKTTKSSDFRKTFCVFDSARAVWPSARSHFAPPKAEHFAYR